MLFRSQLATINLKGGGSKSGFIVARTPEELTLKMAGGLSEKIATKEIAKTSVQRISIMPEGLIQSLTAQEAVDLIDFLSSLR